VEFVAMRKDKSRIQKGMHNNSSIMFIGRHSMLGPVLTIAPLLMQL